jgi:hypothetical protein
MHIKLKDYTKSKPPEKILGQKWYSTKLLWDQLLLISIMLLKLKKSNASYHFSCISSRFVQLPAEHSSNDVLRVTCIKWELGTQNLLHASNKTIEVMSDLYLE